MKTNKKASVIRENAEQSERFINEYQAKYLPIVTAISKTIEGMGIAPTKELICDAINGNFEPIETAYREVLKPDAEMFKSPAGKASIEAMFNNNLAHLKEMIGEMFAGSVGNSNVDRTFISFEDMVGSKEKWGCISMTAPSLFLFDLNDSGEAMLSDEAKEQIIDAFREYATPAQDKAYQAQLEVAKAINKLTAVLDEAGVIYDLGSPLTSGIFLHRFFKVSQSDSREFTVAAKIEGLS